MSKYGKKDWMDEKDKIIHRIPIGQRPFNNLVTMLFRRGYSRAAGRGAKDYFHLGDDNDIYQVNFGLVGATMETSNILLREINSEAEASKKTFRGLLNDMKAGNKNMRPGLLELSCETRTSRVEITTELQKALTVMKDVRKFFLESEYIEEVARLGEVVSVVERMKALIQDGTYNIVLKLIIKKEMNNAKRQIT